MVARPEGHEWGVKGHGAIDNFPKGFCGNVFAEVGIGDREADVLEAEIPPVLPKVVAQYRQGVRHVESIVRRQGAQDGFLEIDAVGGIIGGVVEHGGETMFEP